MPTYGGLPAFTIDDPPDGAGQQAALAQAADKRFAILEADVAGTDWVAGGIVGVTPTGATSGTGLSTISNPLYQIDGKDRTILCDITLGAAIPAAASGNLGNVAVAQVIAALRPRITTAQPLTSKATGVLCVFTLSSDGIIRLASVGPGIGFAKGDVISCGGTVKF